MTWVKFLPGLLGKVVSGGNLVKVHRKDLSPHATKWSTFNVVGTNICNE
jgi:hypothetical protein